MLTCKETSRLTSARQERQLSLKERIGLLFEQQIILYEKS